jgi:hypothetical protein
MLNTIQFPRRKLCEEIEIRVGNDRTETSAERSDSLTNINACLLQIIVTCCRRASDVLQSEG